ncbi:MAG: manganese efflux pump MntP family protein [Helicobacteraceae bacterium]|jgi:putative Mn2+ efflux pump MntP|nr:manganese efflux pump MntP family protein [Helicobacteraceae bacterium]
MEIFFLAFALSMDAFAVALGIGAKNISNARKTALIAALYFGAFQGVMPLMGFLASQAIIKLIESIDHWIAFAILLFIGVKMIKESFNHSENDKQSPSMQITHKTFLLLAIATSIDALAAGLTLSFMSLSPYIGVCIIAAVTFAISYFGVVVGAKSGIRLKNKAELLGGIILIGIGIKILLEHQFFNA